MRNITTTKSVEFLHVTYESTASDGPWVNGSEIELEREEL